MSSVRIMTTSASFPGVNVPHLSDNPAHAAPLTVAHSKHALARHATK
jgi:hypothetical protein